MTVTKTDLTSILGEITATTDTVESGVGYMYFGTNKGNLYKYNIQTGAVTTLQKFPGRITCMLYDASTYIYFGTDMGIIYRYPIATGLATVHLDVGNRAIESMTLYSSVLYVGLSGGKYSSVTLT